MIWNSLWLISLFDGAIVAVVLAAVASLLRDHRGASGRLGAGMIATLLGLGAIGLFHAADLFAMLVLPAVPGMTEAMALMRELHLDLRWPVSLVSVCGMSFGAIVVARRLSRSERTYRQIVDLSPQAIIVQVDGKIVFANPSAQTMFAGASGEHLVGRDSLSVVVPELRGQVRRRREQTLRTGHALAWQEMRHRRLDGSEFSSVMTAAPFIWDRRTGTVNMISETTALKRAEAERDASIRRFRDFAASSADWFFVTDSAHRFTCIIASDAREALLDPADFVGRTLGEVQRDASQSPGPCDGIQPFAERQAFRDLAVRVPGPDGAPRHLLLSARPVFDDSGDFIGYRGAGRDVTEQVRIEAQLNRAQRLRSLGELSGGIAHDFNNVLGVVLGSLELAQASSSDDARTRALLDTALRATRRGAELAGRLLTFARQGPVEPREVPIGQQVEDMGMLLIRAIGGRAGVSIAADASRWHSRVDPGQLESAILNLAINARDAMPDGGEIAIEVRDVNLSDDDAAAQADVAPGAYVSVSVSDTGHGIEKSRLDRIFEPFFTTKSGGGGTGLGLSMVFGFAKQSGGHVSVRSELGAGTTFRLYLPRSGDPIDGPRPDPPRRVETLEARGEEVVLVVEDGADLRTLIVNILSELGYASLEAASPEGALAQLRRVPKVDLMLIDLVLRGSTDGLKLAEAARRIRPGIKCVIMSGYSAQAALRGERTVDRNAFLMKPFSKAALAHKVRGILDGRALSRFDAGDSEPARERIALVVDDDALARMTTALQLSELGFAVDQIGDADAAESWLAAHEPVDLVVTDMNLGRGQNGDRFALRLRDRCPGLAVVIVSGRGLDPPASEYGETFEVVGKPFEQDQLRAAIARAFRQAGRQCTAGR